MGWRNLSKDVIFLARTNTQKNNWEQMYLDGIFWFFLYLRGFVAALHLQMRKYKKDVTTLDYLLSKISSKVDTFHLNQ